MFAYTAGRIAAFVAVLAGMTVLVFGLTQALPGNAAKIILGTNQSVSAQRALEQQLHLNESVVAQYWRWLSHFVRGDMGRSLVSNQPVSTLVLRALEKTLLLAAVTMISVAAIGIAFGVLGALYKGSVLDQAMGALAYAGIALPEFAWGVLLIVVFAGHFRWLPAAGSGGVRHLVLPVATLTLTLVAHVTRQTRVSMIEVMRSNYIRAARARGLSERSVIFRHALRNALLPTITILALDFGFLVGAVVVVETVFAYPGFGRMFTYAIQYRDLPIIQAAGLISAAIYGVMNLVADLGYAYLNPKVRYGSAVQN